MLTVTIFINGKPIITRSVTNRLAECGHYVSDDGHLIAHDPKDGAVELAVKALRLVRDDPDAVLRERREAGR